MQKRPQATTVALIVVGVVVAGLLLFAFLTRGSDSGSLTGRTWQLASITGKTPAFQGVIPPAEQPLYTIAFTTGGSFAARADCNAITGTYTLDRGDGMTITPGPSTLVACPDGSYGSLFAHALDDRDDVGDLRSRADVDHVRWRDRDLRGLRDRASRPDTDRVDDRRVRRHPHRRPPSPQRARHQARRRPQRRPRRPEPTASSDGIPHPAGKRGALGGAVGRAHHGADRGSDTDAPTAEPTAEPTATPAPTPTPTPKPTPAPTATPAPGGDLVGTSWQLASFTTRDPVAGGRHPCLPSARSTRFRSRRAGRSARTPTATC